MIEMPKNGDIAPYVPMVVCPRPFTMEGRTMKRLTPGMSIADMMREFDLNPETLPARVFLDDCLIEKAYWHRVRPKANHIVSVRVIPEGGGGRGKDVLRIVAMIGVVALAVAAPYIAPGGWGLLTSVGGELVPSLLGGLVSSGIGMVGVLAVNGPVPVPLPRRNVLQSIENNGEATA